MILCICSVKKSEPLPHTLYFLYQFCQNVFSVAKQHGSLWLEEKLIFNAGITRLHASLVDDDMGRVLNIQYRHSKYRR